MNIRNSKYMFMLLAALLICAFFMINFSITDNEFSFQSQQQIQLSAVVDNYLKANGNILGAIVQLDILGGESIKAASGYFDSTKTTPISSSDKFTTCSVTKMYTATLIFQLIEDGKIKYDDKIIKHLPSDWAEILKNIEYGSQITIGQALSHRSGITDYITSLTFFNKLLDSQKFEAIELMQLVEDESKPKFKPGEDYSYSNTNYFMLGAVIENITKKPLKKIMHHEIFSKIGLKNTFLPEGIVGSDNEGIAHGYFLENGVNYDFQYLDSGWAWAAGGIYTTAEDLNTFLSALVSRKLFKKDKTFKQMVNLPVGSNNYANGIMSFRHRIYGNHFGHSGYDGASSVAVYWYPDRNAIISVYLSFNGSSNRIRALSLIIEILKEMSFR
ncbi:MAG: beta-lactamase family protein [bacterium]|nr:beta-lactamase family protein [bacterium]